MSIQSRYPEVHAFMMLIIFYIFLTKYANIFQKNSINKSKVTLGTFPNFALIPQTKNHEKSHENEITWYLRSIEWHEDC